MKMNKGMMALKKERPDVAKKMGFMYGGKVKKMMGGGMTMKKMMDGGKTMKNKGFNPKCDGMAQRGKTRARMV